MLTLPHITDQDMVWVAALCVVGAVLGLLYSMTRPKPGDDPVYPADAMADLNERWHETRVSRAPFPHCDSDVLHAPGKCEFCDMYPDFQKLRAEYAVNFTGENKPGFAPCPSEMKRSLETIEKWPGNQPSPLNRRSVGAWTSPDGYRSYPQYANFTAEGDVVTIYARGKETTAGVCGADIAVTLPRAEFDRMVAEVNGEKTT